MQGPLGQVCPARLGAWHLGLTGPNLTHFAICLLPLNLHMLLETDWPVGFQVKCKFKWDGFIAPGARRGMFRRPLGRRLSLVPLGLR